MNFRVAVEKDLEKIVEMLANDQLGAQREDFKSPLPECYIDSAHNK